MAKCECCGKKFKLSDAREEFNAVYEEDGYEYDDLYDGEYCGECAIDIANDSLPAGAEVIELMGTGWDPD